MKLFVAKMKFKDGSLYAHPWTVFAENFTGAVARLEDDDPSLLFSEIIVREVPANSAGFFGRDLTKPDNAAVEHSEISWDDITR